MSEFIPYNPKLKLFARKLRNNMTFSEVLLWNELKSKKIDGYGFNRQKPIDEFIVDFYCKKLKLVIEVDGDSHAFEDRFENDIVRQEKLESFGLKFLRFNDLEVKNDMENVLRTIKLWIEKNT